MLTTTSRGCSARNQARIWARHCSHWVYSLRARGLMMGRYIGGQAILARVSSRQCRWAATCCSAGAHIVAFESPTRATVVAEAVSPDAHSGCSTWKTLRRQLLSNTVLSSVVALARGGVRLEGTALRSAAAATAACIWAKVWCTAVS